MVKPPLILIRLFVISLLLLQSACSAIPTPKLKANAPEQWRNTLNQSTKQVASESATQATWWTSLNDPLLNKSIELALKQNLSLAQALERLSAAQSTEKATIASLYPRIDFTAGPGNLPRPSSNSAAAPNSAYSLRTTRAYIVGFDLLWELPFFGRGESQRKVAKASIALVEADLHTTKINMSAEVVRSYGQLRASQDRLNLVGNLISRHQTLQQLMAQGQQVGLFSDVEQDAARVAMSDLRNEQSIARTQQESALQRLMVLCGLSSPLDGWLSASNSSWELDYSAKPPSTLPANLIRFRPDVRYAEAAVLKASGDAGIAHADLYPRFNIEGALMTAGNLSSGDKRANQTISVLSPSVRIPLLDWGLARELVNAREANLREAVLGYQEAVMLAIEDTENTLTNFNEADERLLRTVKDEAYTQAKTAKINLAFNAGYLSRPELVRLEIKTLEQASKLIDAKVEWISSFAAVNKSLSIMNASSTEQPKAN